MAAQTTVGTTAGSTLHVVASGTAPGTYDVAGYAALTWVAVGEVTDLGEFGREYNLVTHNPVAARSTQKFKGTYNEGSMNLQLGLQTDDAGQVIMKAAHLSDLGYSFKVTVPNGDVYYFRGMVMSWKVAVGGPDNILSASTTIELTTNSAGVGIVESLAA